MTLNLTRLAKFSWEFIPETRRSVPKRVNLVIFNEDRIMAYNAYAWANITNAGCVLPELRRHEF